MLDPFRHSGGPPQTLTITGLTPGQDYDARIYYRHWTDPFNRSTAITFDEDALGPLGATAPDIDGDETQTANYLSYAFTATAAPLQISFSPAPGNQGGSFHLSGFTVQEVEAVPEPASIALWSLLGLGLVVAIWSKRRRK
jgi:hypothetical protein